MNNYVSKVYQWLTAGIVLCCLGATIALNMGDSVQAHVLSNTETVAVPPIVAFIVEHIVIAIVLFLGTCITCSFLKGKVNAAMYLLFTFFTGIFISPSLFIAELYAKTGNTLSGHPVRDAGILTVLAFSGLTAYAMKTKKDFSFLGGFLFVSLLMLVGAGLLNLFLGSSAVSLGLSYAGVLIFSGFILYDTQRIMRTENQSNPVNDAMSMFLNILNLFLDLLRILSSTTSNDD